MVAVGAVVHVGTQLYPVVGRTNLVWVGLGAGAAAELRPGHRREGHEGEKDEDKGFLSCIFALKKIF